MNKLLNEKNHINCKKVFNVFFPCLTDQGASSALQDLFNAGLIG